MDLILDLSDSSIQKLHLQELKNILVANDTGTGTETKRDENEQKTSQTLKQLLSAQSKGDLSSFLLKSLPLNTIPYHYLDELPENINVCLPVQKNTKRSSFVTTCLRTGTAYIVSRHQESGSYADVFTMVAYNGHLSVIKTMEELDAGLYEIVTQMYLSEQVQKIKLDLQIAKDREKQQRKEGLPENQIQKVSSEQMNKGGVYKNIKVPSVLFLQQKEKHYVKAPFFDKNKKQWTKQLFTGVIKTDNRDGTFDVKFDSHFLRQNVPAYKISYQTKHLIDFGMEKATGLQITHIDSHKDKLIALAHICKALWHLQRDYQFMHRDLSSANVLYDEKNNNVTFIDFGFSCVNPKKQKNAWQGPQTFFKQHDTIETRASTCTNKSFDLCTLIAHLAHGGLEWFQKETKDMKEEMKIVIDASTKEFAKQELRLPTTPMDPEESPEDAARDRDQYTAIDKPDWLPGNLLTGTQKNYHWWLYNLMEFPVEKWFPENLLTRVLEEIDFKEWFAIRRNWTTIFDASMPKNIRMNVLDNELNNKKGVLVKLCRSTTLKIRFDGELITEIVLASNCRRIK
mgnify:CR=1 FL=1